MLSILATSAVETSSGEDAAVAVEVALVEAGARDEDDDKACRGVVVTAFKCFACRRKVRSRDRSML